MPAREHGPLLFNEWTKTFLQGSAELPDAERCGERFAAVYPLNRYTFPDGREYREIVQAVAKDTVDTIVYLIGLETDDGKWIIDSFWDVHEIAEKELTVIDRRIP